jgi:phage tail sheath protein FI
MAEKMVSPGVFTKENDLSFLQQGVAEIGAAFIGPFLEGPVVPTIVNSQAEFEQLFGAADGTYYTPLAVQNYLREAGTATICRVAGVGGYTAYKPLLLTVASSSVSASVGILFPTDKNILTTGLSGSAATTVTGSLGSGDFTIFITGSTNFSGTSSLDNSDVNDIESTFGTSPLGSKGAYVYGFFKNHNVPFVGATSSSLTILDDQLFTFDAQEALTPMIKSQTISGQRYDLFQIQTLGVGNSANTKVKIGISNIKAAGSVNGTDYGTFTIIVRDFNDTDKKKVVLETYSNVNLDPNSPNFISRVIGDRKLLINDLGKITETGDWVNNSKYIRIANLDYNAPVQAVPFGHSAYTLPISASAEVGALIPKVTFGTGSIDQSGSINYAGIDLDFNTDNSIYLKPIPTDAGVGSNSVFGLDSLTSTTTALTNLVVGDARAQFIVAFQEGFDGMSPATPIAKAGEAAFEVGTNSQGFDLSTASKSGSVAYAKHIAALSNADEFDINMVVTPGVVRRLHPSVVTSVLDMVEQRNDCFYIMDSTSVNDSIIQVTGQSNAVDSNMVATYYPWVKTIDINTNKLISVPPSVLLPGVFAANDRVAAEWFAPAGLNRGGLVGAVSVLNRLTQSEKDELYEGKVNPIVQFPGQGIVVFGQKTLQDKPSALDRINVRRLLLTVRKYIASTSRYLVFEQNTSETRNRFLNIVNPYLESIQQRQGLYAFRVVMDDSNNTPDVIDRNIMKGAIYLQPTKTAEFIQIDFNILPTGAAFDA